MNVFGVAETLGMTVGEVLDKLSIEEFTYWLAYFKLKAEHLEREMQKRQRR